MIFWKWKLCRACAACVRPNSPIFLNGTHKKSKKYLYNSTLLFTRMIWRKGSIHPILHFVPVHFILFCKSSCCKIERKELILFPKQKATAFAFSSVFILLLLWLPTSRVRVRISRVENFCVSYSDLKPVWKVWKMAS